VSALRGDAPKYPVLSITGEQGSAKSTLSVVLRNLIDPNDAPLRTPSKDIRDLFIAAHNSYTIVFNNLSRLDEWFSDALCCLCEGGGFAVRQNYSDDAEMIFKARRPIILNGIADVTTKSDLLDRAICLHLPTVPEHERKNENEFWATFEAVRPQILGAFLTATCAAMRNLPGIKPTRKEPRMIDFALWARAAETALGFTEGDFMRAYLDNRETGNAAAIENSPLALSIRDFIENQTRGFWFGSCQELLTELKKIVDPDYLKAHFPKTPSHLSRQVKRIAPNLRLTGISITDGRTRDGVTFTVQKLDKTE
jgi:putative DNA primase/helicase